MKGLALSPGRSPKKTTQHSNSFQNLGPGSYDHPNYSKTSLEILKHQDQKNADRRLHNQKLKS